MKITRNTTVEIGLVLTLIAAAVTFGIMKQKVSQLERVPQDIVEIKQDVAGIKAEVRAIYNYVFEKSARTAKNP